MVPLSCFVNTLLSLLRTSPDLTCRRLYNRCLHKSSMIDCGMWFSRGCPIWHHRFWRWGYGWDLEICCDKTRTLKLKHTYFSLNATCGSLKRPKSFLLRRNFKNMCGQATFDNDNDSQKFQPNSKTKQRGNVSCMVHLILKAKWRGWRESFLYLETLYCFISSNLLLLFIRRKLYLILIDWSHVFNLNFSH